MAEEGLRDLPARRPRISPALRLDLYVLGLVVLVWAVVAVVVFPGPHPNDPAHYFHASISWPAVHVDYWTLRLGIIGPLVALERLFGPDEVALYALPAAGSLLLAASAYGIMRTWAFGPAIAAAGALVTLLNQDYLLSSPYVFPDPLATASFTAGMFLLFYARPRDGGPADRYRTPLVVLAGVLFGGTYLIREFSPVLAPSVVAAVLLLRYSRRRVLALVGSTVATGAIDLVYGFAKYDDPLIRLRVLLHGQEGVHNQLWARFREQVDDPFSALLVLPRLLLSWRTGWIMIVLLVVFLVTTALLRDRLLVLLAVWLVNYWAVMVFFSVVRNGNGDLYVNVPNERYWYPLLPPLVMGGVCALASLARRLPVGRVAVAPSVVAGAAAVGLLVPGTIEYAGCASQDVWRNEPQQRWTDIREWLAGAEAHRYDRILAAVQSERLLVVFSRTPLGRRVWDGALRPIPKLGRPVPSDDAATLVFVDERQDSGARLESLEAGWVPVHVTPDGGAAFLAPVGTAVPVSPADRLRWYAGQKPRDITAGECGISPYETT